MLQDSRSHDRTHFGEMCFAIQTAKPVQKGWLFCLPYQEYSHPNGFSLNFSVVLVEMPLDTQIHFYGTLAG